jgi:hypothetical protein
MVLSKLKWVVFATALLILKAPIALADTLFTATYEGEYSNMNITMTRTLSVNDEQFRLTSNARSFMARIDEASDFRIAGNTLQPQTYSYRRKIFGIKKSESLDFDWRALSAIYKEGSQNKGQTKLVPTALDPTLYQLQLQRDVATFPDQVLFRYSFIRRNQVKTYSFKRVGFSPIHFNKMTYQAIELVRTDVDEKETRLWLIPELDWVLAKIKHTEEDGDIYEVTLTGYEGSHALTKFMKTDPP